MQAILVTPKNEQEYSLVMAMLKKMRIKTTEFSNEEPFPMTVNDFHAMIDHSLQDADEGRTTSNADLKKKMKGWG